MTTNQAVLIAVVVVGAFILYRASTARADSASAADRLTALVTSVRAVPSTPSGGAPVVTGASVGSGLGGFGRMATA